ncbi:PepSY-associated TM region (PiuB) (PUBMED:15124630) [Commensalibacter communis]|uniref:PepSY-associated TM helix domain-containing protein n=1 Tax=Commensalibacter communis TaxID=2972786 RepID=UPI0022FF820A|nr:PepSY-associated TM helix domain-containing protein [Commensalibacter communis]CAI3934619.1 PepSY-associated TM region (PiuB) (PUBMED:15124630) [Commensalibacter communis]
MLQKTLSILTLIHRWGGLIGGWFCFFLVVTGTISIFDLEISRWMQPELAQYTDTGTISEKSMDTSYRIWQDNTRQNRFSFVILPTERYPFIYVLSSQGALFNWQNIDPVTGKVIQTQPTVGGYFFDSLHNSFLLTRPAGDIVIIVLSIAFFIFILSGFIIHLKHLWKEFFKVRPKASALRFVLDIHLGIGVFFFPFLLLMVVSGFLFYAPIYMSFLNPSPSHYVAAPYQERQATQSHSQKSLFSLVQEAKTTFKSMPGFILITPKQIHVVQSDADQLAIMRNYIELDRASHQVSLQVNHPTFGRYILNVMFGLHLTRAGGDVLRWVYFVAGTGSSILVATGLLFFSNKRRHFNKKHISSRLLFFYKVIDGIHVGAMMGTLLAIVSVFLVNTVVLADNTAKTSLEINAFLVVLVLSFVEGLFYSFYSSVMHAWKHQIVLFTCLCMIVPVLKMILYPEILNAFWSSNFVYTAINIFFVMTGISFFLLYRYLKRKNAFI